MPVECGESFGHAFAASASKGKKLEGLNSLVCRSIARPAIGVVISSLSNSAAATVPPVQSPLIPPFIEPMSFQADDKTDQSRGSLVFPKHELSSDGVICHNLKPCHPQSDTFEVQLSETCQRRFVMFDHSGSKNRIIFHPSLVNEFPTLLQSPHNTGNCWEPKQDVSTRAVGYLKETLISPPLSGDYPAFDTILPPGWRSALLTNREEDLFRASDGADVEGYNQSRIPDCLSRENSEDLEALLWSDDEMSSTGHSPSDLTRSNTHSSSANGSSGYSACYGKKRKAGKEADTESTATSGNPTSKKVFCSNSELLGRGSGYGKEGLTVFDLSFADEASSSGSTNNQRQHELQCSAPEQSVKRKTRKEKLQSTLHILRSIIPGGETMDTALVLDEAVQFVKNLQVEVQKLEAKKSA